jgi:SPP1 gp7 family putative phage head morphogenesis protein
MRRFISRRIARTFALLRGKIHKLLAEELTVHLDPFLTQLRRIADDSGLDFVRVFWSPHYRMIHLEHGPAEDRAAVKRTLAALKAVEGVWYARAVSMVPPEGDDWLQVNQGRKRGPNAPVAHAAAPLDATGLSALSRADDAVFAALPGALDRHGGNAALAVAHAAQATDNARWNSDDERIEGFKDWLRSQLDGADGLTDEDLWQRYIRAGYEKGALRAYADARVRPPHPLAGPVSVDTLKHLIARMRSEIDNVADDAAQRATRILADGMVSGQSPRAVSRAIAGELGVSQKRAERTARTEFIRAHAEGQLDSYEAMGHREVGLDAEFVSTKDDRVCPECEELDGAVMSVDEARGVIPVHPECRCAWVPAAYALALD